LADFFAFFADLLADFLFAAFLFFATIFILLTDKSFLPYLIIAAFEQTERLF